MCKPLKLITISALLQPLHFWHFGLDNPLWTIRCLTASLASTHEMASGILTLPTSHGSPDRTRCSLSSKTSQLTTTGLNKRQRLPLDLVISFTFFPPQILTLRKSYYLTYTKITKRLWPQEIPCCIHVLGAPSQTLKRSWSPREPRN